MKNLLLVFVLLLSTITANCQKNYLEESNEDFARRMKWFITADRGTLGRQFNQFRKVQPITIPCTDQQIVFNFTKK